MTEYDLLWTPGEGGRTLKTRNECHRKKQARKAEKREMERNF